MSPDPACQLGFGGVMHRRRRPVVNTFHYRGFFLRINVAKLEEARAPGFSVNRFNWLSFHEADHGDGGNAAHWARDLLAYHGIEADGDLWLVTYPRMLGYAFKPVSFWHCHAADGTQVATLAEVNNTFGERHVYLLRTDAGQRAAKSFHVSPFFPVRGEYTFRFDTDPGWFRARVDYADARGPLLDTAWWGRLQPLSGRAVAHAVLAYPLMTAAVVARIHWQALRLWAKRVPFFSKPPAPQKEVTE